MGLGLGNTAFKVNADCSYAINSVFCVQCYQRLVLHDILSLKMQHIRREGCSIYHTEARL